MTGRRAQVLAALRAAGDGGLSGETLAGRLGVSRVAVGKHVAALRELGYAIRATPGSGYRLEAAPDAPLPEEVSPLLRSDLWRELRGGRVTGSTNDDAKALAAAGAAEGTVVLASRQTGGRGRMGRGWESPSGGVYLSVVVRPAVAVHEAPPLALTAALGVSLGVESLGVSCGVKWPNDVLLGDGKLAGVLLEVAAEADALAWAVVGVGVNVRPAGKRVEGAAYLADAIDPAPGLAAVAAAVLDGLAESYSALTSAGFAAVRDAYARRLALAGRAVVVRDRNGDAVAQGVARGVDEWGRLLVEGSGGTVAVAAGEVTLRD